MTKVEFIAIFRMALYLFGLYFTVRARYWLLSSVLAIGACGALASALGASRDLASIISIPQVTILILHALDITRLPRRDRVLRGG